MATKKAQPKTNKGKNHPTATKKTAVKKSTSKLIVTPPKPKLIDGLYSHKFTARILPDAGDQMELILKQIDGKSYMKVIELALKNYLPMMKLIEDLRAEKRQMTQSADRRGEMLLDIQRTFKNIQEYFPMEFTGEQKTGTWECFDCTNDFHYKDEQPKIDDGDKLCDQCFYDRNN